MSTILWLITNHTILRRNSLSTHWWTTDCTVNLLFCNAFGKSRALIQGYPTRHTHHSLTEDLRNYRQLWRTSSPKALTVGTQTALMCTKAKGIKKGFLPLMAIYFVTCSQRNFGLKASKYVCMYTTRHPGVKTPPLEVGGGGGGIEQLFLIHSTVQPIQMFKSLWKKKNCKLVKVSPIWHHPRQPIYPLMAPSLALKGLIWFATKAKGEINSSATTWSLAYFRPRDTKQFRFKPWRAAAGWRDTALNGSCLSIPNLVPLVIAKYRLAWGPTKQGNTMD